MARAWLSVPLTILALATFVTGQTAPTSAPQALNIVAKSVSVLNDGGVIGDVTLIGEAMWNGGESVPITLMAKGVGQGRMELSTPDLSLIELQGLSIDGPACWWTDENGTIHESAVHNCLTDAAWFFPGLSRLTIATSSSEVFQDLGEVTVGGVTLRHIQSWQTGAPGTRGALAELPRLSEIDFFLDPTSALPLIVSFNIHPDDDAGQDIPVEVHFSDYRKVGGVQVPFRIRKFVNGAIALDITLSGAQLNSGLADSLFTAN